MKQSDFTRWKADPVTQAWFESLAKEKSTVEASIHEGACLAPTCEEIALRYAQRIGETKGLEMALEHCPEWARGDE